MVNFCGVGHHENIRFIRFLYLEVIPELTWIPENIWTARLIYHLVCQFTISDQNVTFDQSSFDERPVSTSSTMSNVTDTYLLTYLLTHVLTYLLTLPSVIETIHLSKHFGWRILNVLIENSSRLTNRNEDYESL